MRKLSSEVQQKRASIGRRISAALTYANLTQQDLAHVLQVSQAMVNQIIHGHQPGERHINAIAQACGVDEAYITKGTIDKTDTTPMHKESLLNNECTLQPKLSKDQQKELQSIIHCIQPNGEVLALTPETAQTVIGQIYATSGERMPCLHKKRVYLVITNSQ